MEKKSTQKRIKILYFTFLKPTEKHGGGIAILQSLNALCSFADVEYVGPQYDSSELELYNIKPVNSHFIYSDQSKVITTLYTITRAISTNYYNSWKKVTNSIQTDQYDCCFMDFATHDFVIDWAHKKKLTIIVRAHNVERDYYRFYDAINHRKKSLFGYLFWYYKSRAEKMCIKKADKIIAITNSDRIRLSELYHHHGNIDLLPVCVRHFEDEKFANLPQPFVAITGQLALGPNSDGTLWFLKNVWPNLSDNITDKYALVIAGGNPTAELKQITSETKNVYLYDTPDSIDVFYQQAVAYVAPIFYGAGMKVKIAEALSCGLPVFTTEHAYAGYESIDTELLNVCENKDSFIEKMSYILTLSDDELEKIRRRILDAFESNFSLKISSQIMEDIVTNVIKSKESVL